MAGSGQGSRTEMLEAAYDGLKMAPKRISTSQSWEIVNVILHDKVLGDVMEDFEIGKVSWVIRWVLNETDHIYFNKKEVKEDLKHTGEKAI
jgi:hypothetical protein